MFSSPRSSTIGQRKSKTLFKEESRALSQDAGSEVRGSKPSGPAAAAQRGHRRDPPVALGAEWTRGGLADCPQGEGNERAGS